MSENRQERDTFGRQGSLFLRGETECLDDTALLELLFGFAVSAERAHNLAQALISRFGSLAGLFDAGEDEIKASSSEEDVAAMIKLVLLLCMRYIDEKTNISGECYDNIEKLGRYLVGRYSFCEEERVILLCLDNSYRLISEDVVCEGSVSSAHLSGKGMCELALAHNAASVVLAHNHPRGIALPSSDDIKTTARLSAVFDEVGIPLVEHILVAGNEYTPIMYTKLGKKRAVPMYGEV